MADTTERPEPVRPAAPTLSTAASTDSELRAASTEAFGLETEILSPRRLAWRRFRRHKLAVASLAVLAFLVLSTALAPLLAPYSYREQDPLKSLLRPQVGHWFGTDNLGRDMLSRALYGGRVSLAVGVGVAVSATLIGTTIGSVAGYLGGRVDNLLMRITDLFLSVPLLIILIIAARVFGGGILDIVLVLSLFFWMPVARIVRGVMLSLKEKEFVEAARAIGASGPRIVLRHLIPNALGPIVVNATLSVAVAVLTESTLSFLGFGIQPPVPTWGNMLFDNRGYTQSAPWLVWFPGLLILLTVLAVNFLGDGLRDALDPTQRRVRT